MRPNVLDAPNHAKAEAALEHFEALGHKQSYWLESANGAG
jgi:hypothetical protein